jgi:lipopolysaccharide kinase (Kdo/WaaP) family protein
VSAQIQPAFEPLLRHLGFSEEWVFFSDRIVAWRRLEDRENCTLDAAWPDGRAVRLHVKRYPARWGAFAEREAGALMEMQGRHGIACATPAAWGRLADGRAFLMTEDLAGFEPADKFIARGGNFDRILAPTADLAARLHSAGLHHRDLYLCHFLLRPDGPSAEVKLIDAARVGRLSARLLRRRWIVKDLAQFWYSCTRLPIIAAQRGAWLSHYAARRGIEDGAGLRRAVEAKSRRIEAHDVKLNRRQPTRHVSIPS